MQSILNSMILCGLQVTVVALFGLAVSWLLMRMRPTLAPTILCSTVVAVAVLTLLAPLPSPVWFDVTALPMELGHGVVDTCNDSPSRSSSSGKPP